ncbi:shikimate dehydrogenase [uncultured Desulfosarcina sp.]|uniref:shikimate dehydrogenase family protein n=1 Tax=uncultured Desulfosarcina sp. TaxID=218289 RepID=UPI0029C71C77|nr:shikimate dehydrogenase [uncultured Desulfosarcina sp.]
MKRFLENLDPTYDYQTKVFCIISDQRVFQSKSPHIFTHVMGRAGLKGAYVPFMVEPGNLGKALESLRVLNIAGANITSPFKEKVLPYLDILSEGANIIGAVNTIVRKGDQLKGYNTNAIGIMDALNEVAFDVAGKRALVIGTGGAARAVVFILNWLRADSVTVAGRDEKKTRCLAEHFDCRSMPLRSLGDAPLDQEIVVNATSVSGSDESGKLSEIAGCMHGGDCRLVFDLNYGRRNNVWQALADRWGVRFMDGLSTLAYQARRTFLLWTGQELPQEEFLKALDIP